MEPPRRRGAGHFKCDVCGQDFLRASNLQFHKWIHDGERRYECDVCHKKYSSTSNLSRHYKHHNKKRVIECEVCGKSFGSAGNLTNHKKVHARERTLKREKSGNASVLVKSGQPQPSKPKKIVPKTTALHKCKFCSKSLSKTLLAIHVKKFHQTKETYKCRLCEKDFIRRSHLVAHLAKHSTKTAFKCDFCGKRFKYRSGLYKHKKKHHPEKRQRPVAVQRTKKLFKCKVCHKVFGYSSNLSRHSKLHETETSAVKCEFCGKSFIRESMLLQHACKPSETKPQKLYKCETCNKLYKYKFSLTRHIGRRHCGLKKGVTKVEKCGKGVKNLPEGNACTSERKTGGKYKCNICPKRYKFKFSLVRHIRRHHADNHVAKTETCSSFAHLPGTNRNIDQDCSEGVHKCNVCNKQYKTAFALMCHKKVHAEPGVSVDTDQEAMKKSHKCDVCNKEYVSKFQFMSHKKCRAEKLCIKTENCDGVDDIPSVSSATDLETVKEINKCNICNREFKHKLSLENHEKSHIMSVAVKTENCGGVTEFPGKSNCSTGPVNRKTRHKCSICNVDYKHKFSLVRHNKKRHSEIASVKTESCGNAAGDTEGILSEGNQENAKAMYKCYICNKMYKYKFSLQRHNQQHAGSTTTVETVNCNSMDSDLNGTLDSADKHQIDHKESYTQPLDQSFTSENNTVCQETEDLYEVPLVIVDDRPCQCRTCGKSFTEETILKNHRKSCTGAKLYNCKRCSACFVQLCDFLSHQRSHNAQVL